MDSIEDSRGISLVTLLKNPPFILREVALHRKAIAGNQQRRPPFNPDQTELALIYDSDNGSLLAASGRTVVPLKSLEVFRSC